MALMTFSFVKTLLLSILVVLFATSNLQNEDSFVVQSEKIESIEDSEKLITNINDLIVPILISFFHQFRKNYLADKSEINPFPELFQSYTFDYSHLHSGIDPPVYI